MILIEKPHKASNGNIGPFSVNTFSSQLTPLLGVSFNGVKVTGGWAEGEGGGGERGKGMVAAKFCLISTSVVD